MRYTFTNDAGKEQTITIPDDYLKRNKSALGLSTKEIILMYLSDEGYISNDVVEALTEKAKGVKGATERKPRKAPKRKEDPTKRAIIESIYQFMLSGQIDDALMFDRTIAPVEVVNPERIIAFSVGNDKYELTLSKKRAAK